MRVLTKRLDASTKYYVTPKRQNNLRPWSARRLAVKLRTLCPPAAGSSGPVIPLDKLDALDLTIWLGSGDQAALRLQISQSNVSRRLNSVLKQLDLKLLRHEQEWQLRGPAERLDLLGLERQVHQMARWQDLAPRRLEGTYWSGPLLATPEPDGWIGGTHCIVGVQRPLLLLRQRLIDGWIGAGPDWPAPDDPDLAVLMLCRLPVHLVVAPDHPLARRMQAGAALCWDDVAAYPALALPPGAYPQVEVALRRLGLWNTPLRMNRYRRERWEGRTEAELQVGYATVLSEQIAGRLVRLPLALPFSSGEALVVHRQWVDHPHTRSLWQLLLQRLQPWAAQHPELELCPCPWSHG